MVECKLTRNGSEVFCLAHNQLYAGCVLDERDKLQAELAEAKSKSTFRSAEVAFRDRRDLRREVDALKSQLRKIKDMSGKQAEDEGLWFVNASASEAYLQQELRSLHTLIEKHVTSKGTIVVDPSGKGNAKTIQEGLDMLPPSKGGNDE